MKKFISILMTMLLLLTLAGGSTVFAATIDLETGLTTDSSTGVYGYIGAGNGKYSSKSSNCKDSGSSWLYFRDDSWAIYTVNAPNDGIYDVSLRVASFSQNATFGISVGDGTEQVNSLVHSNASHTVLFLATIELKSGENQVKIRCIDTTAHAEGDTEIDTSNYADCHWVGRIYFVKQEATATTVTFTDSNNAEVSVVPAGTLNATVTLGTDVTDEADCYLAVYKEKDGVKELIGYDKVSAGETPSLAVTGIETAQTGYTYDAKVFIWKSDLTTAIKAYSIGASAN